MTRGEGLAEVMQRKRGWQSGCPLAFGPPLHPGRKKGETGEEVAHMAGAESGREHVCRIVVMHKLGGASVT